MIWNEKKRKEMLWDGIEGAQCLFSWDVIQFLSISFYLLPFPSDFNSFLPCPSIIFYLLSFSRSMQYLPFPSLQLFSILFISFPFEYICLPYFQFSSFLQMIKPSRMIREIKQNYGPQSILIIWIVSLSMILK